MGFTVFWPDLCARDAFVMFLFQPAVGTQVFVCNVFMKSTERRVFIKVLFHPVGTKVLVYKSFYTTRGCIKIFVL